MKFVIFGLILFTFLLSTIGCNKDEEMQDLENEIKSSEEADLLAGDSVEAIDPEIAVAEGEEMTPETMPDEVAETPSMPIMDLSGYTVQVAAGTDYNRAVEAMERYKARGYESAFMVDAVVEGETFYRIRIGAYEDINDARALASELKDKYSIECWIDNN